MRGVVSEIVGLFVDDGFLAVALLAWVATVAIVRALVPGVAAGLGPALLAGGALILLGTVARASRH